MNSFFLSLKLCLSGWVRTNQSQLVTIIMADLFETALIAEKGLWLYNLLYVVSLCGSCNTVTLLKRSKAFRPNLASFNLYLSDLCVYFPR